MVTTAFRDPARSNAAAMGIPNLRLVVLPHPVGHLPPDSVRDLARAAYPKIVAALTEPTAGESEYLVDFRIDPESEDAHEAECENCVD